MKECDELRLDGIDLDFEHLEPALQKRYSQFMRDLADRLHAGGRRLSICVGYYSGSSAESPEKHFYDALVVGKVCDQIRIMCYDLHWAPGATFGPTSTVPWAKEAMRYWCRHVPREKLIMGLPAYSNDFDVLPGGKGVQVYSAKPQIPTSPPLQPVWLEYEKLRVYRYVDGDGRPHVFFASDEASTKAHLETVEELNIPAISFWTYNSVAPETWKTLRNWLK
jgi:spore germination protein YaaH